MIKYGVTRNWLHKIITRASRPGGSQYQQTIKKEKPAIRKKELQVKTEPCAPVVVPRQKSEETLQHQQNKTPVLFRTTKYSQSEISDEKLFAMNVARL